MGRPQSRHGSAAGGHDDDLTSLGTPQQLGKTVLEFADGDLTSRTSNVATLDTIRSPVVLASVAQTSVGRAAVSGYSQEFPQ
jgi:hypothetical protein